MPVASNVALILGRCAERLLSLSSKDRFRSKAVVYSNQRKVCYLLKPELGILGKTRIVLPSGHQILAGVVNSNGARNYQFA